MLLLLLSVTYYQRGCLPFYVNTPTRQAKELSVFDEHVLFVAFFLSPTDECCAEEHGVN